MQQLDGLRRRVNPSNEWFRIGLASATVMAPLLKRWSDLRDADRTRALRDEAEARWRAARSRFAVSNPFDSRRKPLEIAGDVADSVSGRSSNAARIWLIGVGFGLVAAGTGAYFLVQRRMRQSLEEPLVDLPISSSNGHGAAPSAPAGRATTAAPAPSEAPAGANGATATAAEAATTTPAAQSAQSAQSAQQTEPAATAAAELPEELPGGATTVTASGAPAGVLDADEAPFVGNIHTMVYHDRDDENLPAEENRIYFASEEEAQEQGYRRDRADTPSAGTEAAQEAGGAGI